MSKSSQPVEKTNSQRDLFVAMAIDMSWRLALVVLVPIVGGFELDKHFKTTPLLTIVGLVLASLGVALVMRQTLQVASKVDMPSKEKSS